MAASAFSSSLEAALENWEKRLVGIVDGCQSLYLISRIVEALTARQWLSYRRGVDLYRLVSRLDDDISYRDWMISRIAIVVDDGVGVDIIDLISVGSSMGLVLVSGPLCFVSTTITIYNSNTTINLFPL